MKYGSIDIGTNSVLLLILEKESSFFKEILDISEVPRLGENLTSSGILKDEAILRTLLVLEKYNELLAREGVEKRFIFGTAVLREAKNRDVFLKRVKDKIGIEPEILSEKKEAFYSFLSVVMDEELEYKDEIILDLGGGSTEVIYGKNKKMERFFSFPFGVVKLKEVFFKTDPPDESMLIYAEKYLSGILKERLKKEKKDLCGVGGTVTNLAGILTKKSYFDKKLIHGMTVSKKDVEELYDTMKRMTYKEIEENFPSLEKSRADVIFSGTLALKCIMDFFESEYLKVSTKGLRYGIIYERA
ncbi:MAG: Ppx/GppA family phosphatase [Desulfobacterota bacterium]|nr:Ppx/GppA family phosphatase [Thermodesulfobacteriota bacterium]MDW8002278.1 Ppx/GppA phosphatase family protein [Deltaproteobacteria bacterium]